MRSTVQFSEVQGGECILRRVRCARQELSGGQDNPVSRSQQV